jgi:hypothetical protein
MSTGTPDPVEAMVAAEERRDHLWARARGERVDLLATLIVSALRGDGIAVPEHAHAIVFRQIADFWYGNAAIDFPRRPTGAPS